VGWSPAGIDYGAPDNEPVHLLVMYFVPDTQKNAYLKEISSLAKAIQTQSANR
jgi:PTS system nitrogen regulatory IIA component